MASWVALVPRVYRAETLGGLPPLASMWRLAASQAYRMSERVGVPSRSVIRSSCWIGEEACNRTFVKLGRKDEPLQIV